MKMCLSPKLALRQKLVKVYKALRVLPGTQQVLWKDQLFLPKQEWQGQISWPNPYAIIVHLGLSSQDVTRELTPRGGSPDREWKVDLGDAGKSRQSPPQTRWGGCKAVTW